VPRTAKAPRQARPSHYFIQSYCHQGQIGVLIELGLESWVATEQEQFLALSRDLAMQVAASSPESADAMLRQPFFRDPTMTVEAALLEAAARLGEKVSITRIVRWDQRPSPPTVSARA
jgi:elongation factor Ts